MIKSHININNLLLQMLTSLFCWMLGQGSFGMVHSALWRGSLVAAKVIPVQISEATSIAREIDILR